MRQLYREGSCSYPRRSVRLCADRFTNDFLGALMATGYPKLINMVSLDWLVRLRSDTLGYRSVRTRMRGVVWEGGD